MKEMKWVVRVVLLTDPTEEMKQFLDHLRYAGCLAVHNVQSKIVFDILPPKGTMIANSRRWAKGVADRMRHNHYNAQACPESIPVGV